MDTDLGFDTRSLNFPVHAAQTTINLMEPMQICDNQNIMTAPSISVFPYPCNYLIDGTVSEPTRPTPSSSSIPFASSLDDIPSNQGQVELDIVASESAISNPPPAVDLKSMTVVLHQGVDLTFYSDDIPAIPALRFTDVKALACWWDDASPEWRPEGYPYRIKGHIVAIKYWHQVYKGDRRWATVKSRWNVWKVRYCLVPKSQLDYLLVYHAGLSEHVRGGILEPVYR